MSDPLDHLRALVQRNRGRKLPGERDLAHELGVSRPRLRLLLDGLRQEGLVRRQHGSGTFAIDSSSHGPSRIALAVDASLRFGADPFCAVVVEAVQYAAREAGLRLSLTRLIEGASDGGDEQGLILLGAASAEALALRDRDALPAVALLLPGHPPRRARASLVQIDERDGGRRAATWLLAQGCDRLVVVGRHDLPAALERLAGMREVLAGRTWTDIPCPLRLDGGLTAAASLICTGRTGLLALNDAVAVGLRIGLRARGIADPPLVAFDGLPLAADPSLGICSLAIPFATLAADAVAELLRLSQGRRIAGRSLIYTYQGLDDR